MQPVKDIYIKPGESYSPALAYILTVLSHNKKITLRFTDNKSNAALVFDHTDPSSCPVNAENFDRLLKEKKFGFENYFSGEPKWTFSNSKRTDWLGTAFYMINSFQEYGAESHAENFDGHRRFRYEKSYQYKYKCIEDNLVQHCFDHFCSETPGFENLNTTAKPTRLFLSHDIDTIHGSFLQDGLWAMKKGRLDIVMQLVASEIVRRPHWTNMDRIKKLHDEHNLKSTFFWLATKKVGRNGVQNADYTTKDIARLSAQTNFNGLHKSAYDTTIDEELKSLPFKTTWNRYHFLKISLPGTWNDIEDSQLNFDASLGFAEHYGFRNNYGLPFQPYKINGKMYDFVEVPLNMMDGTFQRYMQIPAGQTADTIIRFIEKNKTGCVLSLLWHNTFFTNYKYRGYLDQYRKVLLYLNENGLRSITPDEITAEFLHGKEN